MNVIIRKTSPSDLEGIKDLALFADAEDMDLATHSYKLLEVTDPVILSYVAEVDGRIAGFNVGFVLPSGCLIPEGMYVANEYRRKGIAKGLSEALEKGSRCNISMAYYKPNLKEYYSELGYSSGDNVIVGIKEMEEK